MGHVPKDLVSNVMLLDFEFKFCAETNIEKNLIQITYKSKLLLNNFNG